MAEAALVALALAAAYLLVQPLSADHAAQQFRADLFAREGIAVWSNLWFGGHHLPGYSLLSPALGAVLGPRLVGGLAAVAAAPLFAAIAERRWGERARVGVIWFAAATAVSLFTGRITFALGVSVALGAVLAAQRGRRLLAIALAAACPLASPVAAVFLACGGVAQSVAERRRSGIELAATALGVTVLLAAAFPEGGSEPFVTDAFVPALLLTVVAFFVLPADERLLRTGFAIYAVGLLAAYLIANPLGGNATRMGALLAGPLLACALWGRRPLALALLTPALLYWQWYPVVRDLERAHSERSAQAAYYAPLRGFLDRAAGGRPIRVEVLPTANHWEAEYVLGGVAIARGWERQLDRRLNPIFYDDGLEPGEYRRWLDGLAVEYVAVPGAALDYAAESEAALIDRGLPYLRPAHSSPDWRVYRVTDPAPLASPPGELTELSTDGFVVEADRPGTSIVRIRHTSHSSVEGPGCVRRSADGFTEVRFTRPGRLRVATIFAPWRALGSGESCGSP